MESFVVIVESMAGTRNKFVVHPSKTVFELKTAIWKKGGVPPKQQHLVYNCVCLEDWKLLSDCQLQADAVIRLVLSAKAGPLEYAYRSMLPTGQSTDGDIAPSTSSTSSAAFSQAVRYLAVTSSATSSHRQPPVATASVSTTVKRRPGRLSAPEDTSAKESSAGETEGHMCSSSAGEENCYTPDEIAVCYYRRYRTKSIDFKPLVSSHSKNSSTEFLTADEASSAVDEPEIRQSICASALPVEVVELAVKELHFSGSQPTHLFDASDDETGLFKLDQVLQAAAVLSDDPQLQTEGADSDPSEWSSSYCANDAFVKRSKIRRKIVDTRTGRYRRGEYSTGDSSSEGNGETLAKSALNACASHHNYRRTQNRHMPHSSHSQLRCSVCSYRLTVPSTHHCRCGKTLCARHKATDSHRCHNDLKRVAKIVD